MLNRTDAATNTPGDHLSADRQADVTTPAPRASLSTPRRTLHHAMQRSGKGLRWLGGGLAVWGSLFVASQALAKKPQSALQNLDFEADGTAMKNPSGWLHQGTAGAAFSEWGGHTGNYRLSHYSDQDFYVDTKQTVLGLKKGWYTLRGFVKRSPGENGASLELDCGGEPQTVAVPVAWPDQWLQLAVSSYTSHGRCTITLHTDGRAGQWTNFDDVTLIPGRVGVAVRGVDVSSLQKSEDYGGLYFSDQSRRPRQRAESALGILKDHGATHARLRVWVDSADGYHGVDEVVHMAKRAKHQGLELLVDLHYSDSWADPGQQNKPQAWLGYSIEQLESAVYDHTYEVCRRIADTGRAPDMIQIGNELNSGMLWPDGHTWGPPNWENLGRFLKAGYQAVKDCSPRTQVVLHLAEGGDNGAFRWWFDNITAQGVEFDVIAASYYGFWHGSLGDLQYNLNDVASRYDKDVLVAETAYPFTLAPGDEQHNIIGLPEQLVDGYEATPFGQASNLRDVLSIVRAVPDGRGLGVFYWDATWTAVDGNGWDPTDPHSGVTWENQALFDYDGRALPAMSEFLVDSWMTTSPRRRPGAPHHPHKSCRRR